MHYKCTVYFNRLAGNCPSSECIETQLSSTRQEVGLDGDTVVPDYVSKLNYDIKASDNRRSVIIVKVKVQSSRRSKSEVKLAWAWSALSQES